MDRLTERNFDFTSNFVKSHLQSWSIAQALSKLQEYENLDEQGFLLRLPCKVGDTVYAITSPFNLGIDKEDELDVFECIVESIAFYRNGMSQLRLYYNGAFVGWLVRFADIGKTVFFTREEAEQALTVIQIN